MIVARKGSQRLPGKNKMLLNAKPLFQWSLEAALKTELFDEVWVSSDDEDILEISASIPGVQLDKRPLSLCGSDVKATEVLTYMIDVVNKRKPAFDVFCLLQPTSPFRNAYHIKKAMSMLKSSEIDFVVGMKKYGIPPEFALDLEDGLRPKKNGYLTTITRTQDCAKSFHPAGGLFAGKVKPYLETGHFYGKRSVGLILDHIPAWDINDEKDFFVAKILAQSETDKEIII